jgi:hypothetical protein
MLAATLLVAGSILHNKLCSADVTRTNPPTNTGQQEPEGMGIDAGTVFVLGSIRESVPEALVASHTLPAPNVIPPSDLSWPGCDGRLKFFPSLDPPS